MPTVSVAYNGDEQEHINNIREILRSGSYEAMNAYLKKQLEDNEGELPEGMKEKRKELAEEFSRVFADNTAQPLFEQVRDSIDSSQVDFEL